MEHFMIVVIIVIAIVIIIIVYIYSAQLMYKIYKHSGT